MIDVPRSINARTILLDLKLVVVLFVLDIFTQRNLPIN